MWMCHIRLEDIRSLSTLCMESSGLDRVCRWQSDEDASDERVMLQEAKAGLTTSQASMWLDMLREEDLGRAGQSAILIPTFYKTKPFQPRFP